MSPRSVVQKYPTKVVRARSPLLSLSRFLLSLLSVSVSVSVFVSLSLSLPLGSASILIAAAVHIFVTSIEPSQKT